MALEPPCSANCTVIVFSGVPACRDSSSSSSNSSPWSGCPMHTISLCSCASSALHNWACLAHSGNPHSTTKQGKARLCGAVYSAHEIELCAAVPLSSFCYQLVAGLIGACKGTPCQGITHQKQGKPQGPPCTRLQRASQTHPASSAWARAAIPGRLTALCRIAALPSAPAWHARRQLHQRGEKFGQAARTPMNGPKLLRSCLTFPYTTLVTDSCTAD